MVDTAQKEEKGFNTENTEGHRENLNSRECNDSQSLNY